MFFCFFGGVLFSSVLAVSISTFDFFFSEASTSSSSSSSEASACSACVVSFLFVCLFLFLLVVRVIEERHLRQRNDTARRPAPLTLYRHAKSTRNAKLKTVGREKKAKKKYTARKKQQTVRDGIIFVVDPSYEHCRGK